MTRHDLSTTVPRPTKEATPLRFLVEMAAAALLLTSCGVGGSVDGSSPPDGVDYIPKTRYLGPEEKQVTSLSRKILDVMDVEGRVTKSGPAASRCPYIKENDKDYYVVRHPWSLYGAPDRSLQKGMEHLRAQLSDHGWKITRDGKAPTKDQDPELFAVDHENQHKMHAVRLRAATSKEPLIAVTVVSRCFKRPT